MRHLLYNKTLLHSLCISIIRVISSQSARCHWLLFCSEGSALTFLMLLPAFGRSFRVSVASDIVNMEGDRDLQYARTLYCQASRCWRANHFRSCLLICDQLTVRLNKLKLASGDAQEHDLAQLKHLGWFLKIRCLADDYYINESLLLNETDMEDDDQVEIFSDKETRQTRSTLTRATSLSRKVASGTGKIGRSQRTGILTGRLLTTSSRRSGATTSSYRPLTIRLTATQTAFSKSTRPLLKYSTNPKLSKIIYGYLYNAQTVTNRCPDYRQCLEFLNLIKNTNQKESLRLERLQRKTSNDDKALLIKISDPSDDLRSLGAFWLISFGSCYFNLHMNKEAEDYFKEALNVSPKCLDSYTWLVKIYLRSNQPTKVLNICEAGLRQSKNQLLYNWMARVQSLLGDTYATNLNLQESLKHCPTNIEALANVGHFAFYSDKLEQSLKCFERIKQLSANQSSSLESNSSFYGSISQLSNNLALCNFYCGFFHKVMPLFLRSFLNSPNNEVTSDIWYNISFVPLSCGLTNLAIACLRLALKNNSQNEEALNNLGVLKYGPLLNDDIQFRNRQEMWAIPNQRSSMGTSVDVENMEDLNRYKSLFDDAETYFAVDCGQKAGDQNISNTASQPEMIYNMAILKKRRGHLLASDRYCNLYLELDPNNYHVRDLLSQIRLLVSHDS